MPGAGPRRAVAAKQMLASSLTVILPAVHSLSFASPL